MESIIPPNTSIQNKIPLARIEDKTIPCTLSKYQFEWREVEG